jgi:hypothetical protein
VGSPTCFHDPELDATVLEEATRKSGFGIHVPAGALWGAGDIQKMSALGSLKGLALSMTFNPDALKVGR